MLYSEEEIVLLDGADIEALRPSASQSQRRRARVCAHRGASDPLHEMVIVLCRDSYVRPHRHLARPESFHVIAGAATVLLFDDRGAPTASIELGDYHSGRTFYFRIDRPTFHSVVVESDALVFHETTAGPFDPHGTEAASWAPAEVAAAAGLAFLRKALHRMGRVT